MISGTVTDSSFATVAAASVVVTNTDTNTLTQLVTNASGYYEVPLLLPGHYQVAVAAPGFKKIVRSGIRLAPGEQLLINVTLEVGASSESVTVTAEASILAPGAVGGNEWSVDGQPNLGVSRDTAFTPHTDMVGEFKVEADSFDASFGHSTGLNISMSSKSGTNQLHGTATEEYWSQEWAAAPFFIRQSHFNNINTALAAGNTALANQLRPVPEYPPGHSNNFAGTIMGPITIPKLLNGKNRLFFFFAYSGARDDIPARPTDIADTVPTVPKRSGNFSDLLPLGSQYVIYDHIARMPFPNNSPASSTQPPLTNFLANCQVEENVSGIIDYTYTQNATTVWDFSIAANQWFQGNFNDGLIQYKPSAVGLPYFAWYAQDTWRVGRKLTLNLGLRMEYETGPTERYNRAIGPFDPSAQLPISAAAQAAYAANPIPPVPASSFLVQGGNTYLGVDGTTRKLWQNQLMFLPRMAGAYQLGSKMVLRAGYGIYYDTLNVMNESANQAGFSCTTSNAITNNSGLTWLEGNPAAGISPLTDPFPVQSTGSRICNPYGNSLASMYEVGQSYTFNLYGREHPRVQKWRASVQRQLSGNMVLEVSYWGQWADELGGTKTSLTWEYQPGDLLSFPNIYYYGKMNNMSSDINGVPRSPNQWFNVNAPFEHNSANQPASNDGSNFGKVTSQTASQNRFLQIQAEYSSKCR